METRVFSLIKRLHDNPLEVYLWSVMDFHDGQSSVEVFKADDDVQLYGKCIVLWERENEFADRDLPTWWAYKLPIVCDLGLFHVYIYPLKTIEE